jgi:hypothetical protein
MTKVKETQPSFGPITVEPLRKSATDSNTSEAMVNALKATLSTESSNKMRCQDALKSDSLEESGLSTLGMEKPSLLR